MKTQEGAIVRWTQKRLWLLLLIIGLGAPFACWLHFHNEQLAHWIGRTFLHVNYEAYQKGDGL